MYNLDGEIGVLKQGGRQVAGVFDWESRITLNYTVRNSMREYHPHKTMKARGYWLVEPVRDNTFDAELYKVVNGDLVVMDSGQVRIDLPDAQTTDKKLSTPVELVWLGYEC